MGDTNLPSLEKLIRAKIQRRIFAAMVLLFVGTIVITIVETALSHSDLVSRLDRLADALQDRIISEVLVNNQDATNQIVADANRETPDQSVRWITPTESKSQSLITGLVWDFPGAWTFVRPLKRLGDQDFGTFVFSGNFFSGGLLNALTHRLVFIVATCILMAILLLPIAQKTPKELILRPVQHLMALIRDDSGAHLAKTPAFAEIKSIQDDFVSLMRDRHRLESQRLETAQLRTITRTAQMLAHDIRRPFSLLKATLDGLTQTNTSEEMQELVSATVPGVKKSLEHLDGIITELTTVGSAQAEKAFFSLSDAIRRGVAIAAPHEADLGRIAIQLQSDTKIHGVQNQIERVVANIVSNALQAMGPSDRIVIESCDESLSTVAVNIANTGSYIPQEDFENIFQPFFTKGKTDGTGLGLAICRRIVSDHQGTIEVVSTRSAGTSFKLGFYRPS